MRILDTLVRPTQWTHHFLYGCIIFFSLTSTAFAENSVQNTAAKSNQGSETLREIIKAPHDSHQYKHIQLDNGLQVLLISEPGLRQSAAALTVNAGSMHDPENMQGLAHYLEHMIFQSSEKYPEQNMFLDFTKKNNGYTNATTGGTDTNYFFSISNDKYEKALDIFSSHIEAPLLDPNHSQKELNIINEEWARSRENYNFIAFRLEANTANPKHPIHKLNVGNLTTLSKASAEQLEQNLRNFYETHYTTQRMRLTLVSKVSIKTLEKYAKRYFSGLSTNNTPAPTIDHIAFTSKELKKEIDLWSKNKEDILNLSFHIKDNNNLWRNKPNHYLYQLLNSRDDGTLIDTLTKAGLIHNMNIGIWPRSYGNSGQLFIQSTLTDKGKQQQDIIIASILNYLALIKAEGISPERAEKFKETLDREWQDFRGLDPLSAAEQYSTLAFGIPVEHISNQSFIFEYQPEAIHKLLDQLIVDNLRIIRSSQIKSGKTPLPYAKGAYAIKDIAPESIASWAKLGLPSKLPTLVKIDTDEEDIVRAQYLKTPKKVIDANGIHAWLMHTASYRGPYGSLITQINSDLPFKNVKNFVSAHIINNIYRKKTRAYVERTRKSLDLSIYNNNDVYANTTISIYGNTKHHIEIMSKLLSDFMALEITKEDVTNEIAPYIDSLQNVEALSAKDHVYNMFAHALAIAPTTWTNEERTHALQTLTFDEVNALLNDIKTKSTLAIFAHSNYSEDDVHDIGKIVNQHIKHKSHKKLWRYKPPFKAKSGKENVLTKTISREENALSIAYIATKKSAKHYVYLSLLARFHQVPLFSQLRTQNELAYDVQSYPRYIHDYPAFAIEITSYKKNPDILLSHVETFNKAFLAQLEGLSQEQFDNVRINLLKEHTQPRDIWQDVGFYQNLLFFKQKDLQDSYVETLLNASKEELIHFYKRTILGKKREKFIVKVDSKDAGIEEKTNQTNN